MRVFCRNLDVRAQEIRHFWWTMAKVQLYSIWVVSDKRHFSRENAAMVALAASEQQCRYCRRLER